MQIFSRPGTDNVEHLCRAFITVPVVEVRQHPLKKSEGYDHVEFRALDTMNRGDSYASSIMEDLLKEAQFANCIHSFGHKSGDACFRAIKKRSVVLGGLDPLL